MNDEKLQLLEDVILELSAKARSYRNTIDDLEKQIRGLNSTIHDLNVDNCELKHQNDILLAEKEKLENDLNDLREQKANYKEDVENIRAEKDEFVNKVCATIDTTNNRYNAVWEKIKQISDNFTPEAILANVKFDELLFEKRIGEKIAEIVLSKLTHLEGENKDKKEQEDKNKKGKKEKDDKKGKKSVSTENDNYNFPAAKDSDVKRVSVSGDGNNEAAANVPLDDSSVSGYSQADAMEANDKPNNVVSNGIDASDMPNAYDENNEELNVDNGDYKDNATESATSDDIENNEALTTDADNHENSSEEMQETDSHSGERQNNSNDSAMSSNSSMENSEINGNATQKSPSHQDSKSMTGPVFKVKTKNHDNK